MAPCARGGPCSAICVEGDAGGVSPFPGFTSVDRRVVSLRFGGGGGGARLPASCFAPPLTMELPAEADRR